MRIDNPELIGGWSYVLGPLLIIKTPHGLYVSAFGYGIRIARAGSPGLSRWKLKVRTPMTDAKYKKTMRALNESLKNETLKKETAD